MLDVGTQAPSFRLNDQHGDIVNLSDYAGKWVVVWWYPKASTRG
jgi:peroxiredoxin Q/BCP